MRNGLNNWLEKWSPKTVEWIEPCQQLMASDEDTLACLVLAERKEAGELTEEEFVAALCHISGKELDDVEQILASGSGSGEGKGQTQVERVRQDEQPQPDDP